MIKSLLAILCVFLCNDAHLHTCHAQPFSVISFPIEQTLVPTPGQLDPLDSLSTASAATSTSITSTTTTSTASTSSTSTSTTTTTTTATATCTDNWCTQSNQWLPTNVNYIIIGVVCGSLCFFIRKDRRCLVALLLWTATLLVFFLVNSFVSWYVVITIDFAIYYSMYRGENEKREAEEEEEEEEGEDEDEDEDGEGEDGDDDLNEEMLDELMTPKGIDDTQTTQSNKT